MATAKKLPSGNYRVLVYTGKDASGKRQYKSFTDPDKRTAEFLASEYLTRKRKGSTAAELTLAQAIEQYIDSKEHVLSPHDCTSLSVDCQAPVWGAAKAVARCAGFSSRTKRDQPRSGRVLP